MNHSQIKRRTPFLLNKKGAVLSGILCILLFFHLGSSFPPAATAKEHPLLQNYLTETQSAIDALCKSSLAYAEGTTDIAELRTALLNTRLAYKKLEAILTYYYPEHCSAYLNGAPLMHLDPYPLNKNVDQGYYPGGAVAYLNSRPLDYLESGHYLGAPQIIKPEGLQVLDELVFSNEASQEKEHVVFLTKKFSEKFAILALTLKHRKYVQPYEVVEASRLQLIRILSLGITGFDTPGSLNALPETQVSLSALQAFITPIVEEASLTTQQSIKNSFATALKHIAAAQDFESFNRLRFLTEALNPLYKHLGILQKELGLPTSKSLSLLQTPWNPESENIFDENFLNPYYYTTLPKSKHDIALTQLGKKLFYETALSNSNQMSCATCHKPELAFSDGKAQSVKAPKGSKPQRNAPGLINAVFSDRLFYDLKAFDLSDQVGHVIANHLEFNTSFAQILQKLNNDSVYTYSFEQIYGSNKPISRHQFSAALTSYVMSLVSFNSPFDQYVTGKQTHIKPAVERGFNLFMGKAACGTCHFAPLFSGLVPPRFSENESEVLGVLVSPNVMQVDLDEGRAENGISTDQLNIYKRSFKTVSIRNVALTAPYFHNGAYNTLEEVLDFYNHGGAAGLGLFYEVPNQTLAADSLQLSEQEKIDIIAFLHSLTDSIALQEFK